MSAQDVINLTDRERDHFVAYLRQEAETANEMAKQMAKLSPAVADVMVKKFRTEIAGYMIVIDRLAGGEKMQIGA